MTNRVLRNLQDLALSLDRLLACHTSRAQLKPELDAPSEITIFSLYINNFLRNLSSKLNCFVPKVNWFWESSNKNLLGCVWVVSVKMNTYFVLLLKVRRQRDLQKVKQPVEYAGTESKCSESTTVINNQHVLSGFKYYVVRRVAPAWLTII